MKDRAAIRRRDRDPRGEEDDRADDREEHPEQRLDPVRGHLLESGEQQGAIGPDQRHHVATGSSFSPEKTRSMTSSIGGSSSDRSASASPRSATRRAVRAGASARGTRSFTRPAPSLDTTSPYRDRSTRAAPSRSVAPTTLYA